MNTLQHISFLQTNPVLSSETNIKQQNMILELGESQRNVVPSKPLLCLFFPPDPCRLRLLGLSHALPLTLSPPMSHIMGIPKTNHTTRTFLVLSFNGLNMLTYYRWNCNIHQAQSVLGLIAVISFLYFFNSFGFLVFRMLFHGRVRIRKPKQVVMKDNRKGLHIHPVFTERKYSLVESGTQHVSGPHKGRNTYTLPKILNWKKYQTFCSKQLLSKVKYKLVSTVNFILSPLDVLMRFQCLTSCHAWSALGKMICFYSSKVEGLCTRSGSEQGPQHNQFWCCGGADIDLV